VILHSADEDDHTGHGDPEETITSPPLMSSPRRMKKRSSEELDDGDVALDSLSNNGRRLIVGHRLLLRVLSTLNVRIWVAKGPVSLRFLRRLGINHASPVIGASPRWIWTQIVPLEDTGQ